MINIIRKPIGSLRGASRYLDQVYDLQYKLKKYTAGMAVDLEASNFFRAGYRK